LLEFKCSIVRVVLTGREENLFQVELHAMGEEGNFTQKGNVEPDWEQFLVQHCNHVVRESVIIRMYFRTLITVMNLMGW
jgi:hypothetical protein